MSDEESQCEECKPGLPAWMATFADLMSLLMCFFVLLLSFSEMDVIKFKRLAGSLREAFGVQRAVDANEPPKGTSVVALEFSPGKPDPTPILTVQQQTDSQSEQSLEQTCQANAEGVAGQGLSNADTSEIDVQSLIEVKMAQLKEEAESQAIEIAAELQQEIAEQIIEIETQGRKIIIRVEEQGSFASGSAELEDSFLPVMEKLAEMLRNINGPVAVEGHTDDVPIKTTKFRSNWDLSVKRALVVASGLFEFGELDESRFSISGFGENRPLVANDTPEQRAKNRRVEIVLQDKTNSEVAESIQAQSDAVELGGGEALRRILDLDPDELF